MARPCADVPAAITQRPIVKVKQLTNYSASQPFALMAHDYGQSGTNPKVRVADQPGVNLEMNPLRLVGECTVLWATVEREGTCPERRLYGNLP